MQQYLTEPERAYRRGCSQVLVFLRRLAEEDENLWTTLNRLESELAKARDDSDNSLLGTYLDEVCSRIVPHGMWRSKAREAQWRDAVVPGDTRTLVRDYVSTPEGAGRHRLV